MKKFFALVLAALAAAVSLALPLASTEITVSGYTGSAPLENFPVLVRISPERISGFSYADCAAGGADIAFQDAQGNALDREIDTWNPNGESLVWVRVPSLANGTVITMTYADSSVTAQPACQTDGSVWTPAGYVGVWHMNAASPADASASGNNGTAGGSAAVNPAGKVGSALSVPGAGDYVTCGQHLANSVIAAAFSVEGWACQPNYSAKQALFGKNVFVSIRTVSASQITITTPGKKDHDLTGLALPAAGTWYHFALTFKKSTSAGCKLYLNGAFAKSATAGDINDQTNPTEMWLGRNQWGDDQGFKGQLDEMRIAKVIHSADWISASYKTQSDTSFLTYGAANRLGGDFIQVSGSPGAYAANGLPAYGITDSPVAGTYTYAAPDMVALDATRRMVCTGWTLYAIADRVATPFRSSSDAGESRLSCSIDYVSGGYQLVWLWQTQYLVTATACEGGSVSPASQWVAEGETATVTATPDAGGGFYRWTNDVPASVSTTSATISFPVSSPMSLFATFGGVLHVSPAGDGTAPRAGFSTGYATIAEAVAAAQDGDTLLLDAETHTLSGCVTVDKAVRIAGQGIGRTFVTTTATTDRHFVVKHEDAVLEDLEFVGKKITQRSLTGWVVYITAGTIRNCRISGFTQGAYYQSGVLHLNGAKAVADSCEIVGNANNHSNDAISTCAGLYCQNGTVMNCVITGNTSFKASGLWLKAGLVTDTLIAGNRIVYPDRDAKTFGTGTGAYVEGGTMRRCTIIANKGTIYSGVGLHVAGTSARIEDCIVRYNVSPGANALVWPDISCDNPAVEANFQRSRVVSPFGANSDTNCPFFADLANGDYTLVDAFTANRAEALEGETVIFTASIPGDAAWTFTDADGRATALAGNPVSPVLPAGTYDVALAIGGATHTAHGALKIGPANSAPATGAELLQAVAGATDGTAITLAANEYELTDTLVVPCGISITGAGRDATTLKMKSNVNKRTMVIAHPDAVVSNVTLRGGRSNVYGPTRGISLWINNRGGLFTHGRVTASTTKNHYQYGAAAVSSSAGRIANTVVDGNYNIYQVSSGSSHGGGVYAEAGLVENCMVTNNDAFYGAGIVVAGTGSFRNCTVVNNRALKTGGGIFWRNGGGAVVNCVFMGNTAGADTTTGAPNWAPETANATQYAAIDNAFEACAFIGSAAPGDNCFTMNDPFVGYATGDLHPAAGAAGLVDQGVTYEGIAATDLDGSARVQGEAVDIGCYERDAMSISCSFDASATETFYDTAITFTSEIVNPAAGVTYGYAWTFTDRAGAATTFTSANPAVSLPAGRYDVELVVYDIANPSSSISSGVRRNYLHLAPRDIYLLPENAAAAFPWAGWATAGTNLIEAIAESIGGTTIHLGEGTFFATNEVVLTSDIVITGLGLDRTAIRLAPAGRAPAHRVATLDSAGAIIEKVTLAGGRNAANYNLETVVGSGVWIATLGGTLRDCRVTGNVSAGYYQHGAVAVTSSAGLVERCVIDGNVNTHREASSYGGGLYLTKGEARNCIVTNNTSNYGGGVALNGGTLRNCTVAFNHAIYCVDGGHGGGYGGDFTTQGKGGTAVNCIFFGGDQTPWNATAGAAAETVVKEWCGNGDAALTLTACAFPSARGLPTGFMTLTATDCVLFDDPGFIDVANGKLGLRSSSPLKDAGSSAYEWPAGATDLAGRPRVFGKRIDIGCYECQSGAHTMFIMQ